MFETLFLNIYRWFGDANGNLFKCMDAIKYGEESGEFVPSFFPTIGCTAAVVSFLVAFAFYIWPLNHPRFKAWWAWLIMLATNAVLNFGLAFAFIDHRLNSLANDNENEAILQNITSSENIGSVKELIQGGEKMAMAWDNVWVSVIFFIIASLILNWFSVNCRYSPLRK